MEQCIFMVGARASGKTTLGRLLAARLGYRFFDTDQYLLETLGVSVAEIVAQEGWEGFRSREAAALRAVAGPSTVVATGGGMVLLEANRTFMRESGVVLYLHAPAAVLAARLAADPRAAQRPSLTGRPVSEEVAAVLAEREPLYRATASHVLDATVPLKQVLAEALARLAPEKVRSDRAER